MASSIRRTQIARTHSLRGKFDEADRILDDAEVLLDDIATSPEDKTPIAWIRCLLERGRSYNSAGQVEDARPLFLEAWELVRNAREDYHAVDAAHMLGICEPADASVMWNNKAMKAAEVSETNANVWNVSGSWGKVSHVDGRAEIRIR